MYDLRLTEALDDITNGTNATAEKLGVSPVSTTEPPPSIAALNVSKLSDGSLHAVIQDHTPINWGIHYFLEFSTTPGFEQPHVLHLGASRTWVGPNVAPYWRAYSMYNGQSQESARVLNSSIRISGSATGLQPSTGSGTAAGNGKQGGQGFGTVPKRSPVIRSVPSK